MWRNFTRNLDIPENSQALPRVAANVPLRDKLPNNALPGKNKRYTL